MASIINASTTGVGGVVTTADASGILHLQSAGTTIAAISGSGISITGNLLINGIGPLASTKVTTYTSGSGTFTRDAKCLFAQVIVTGGGGGGGGSDSSSTTAGIAASGGGGGGGTSLKWFSAAQLGATCSYAIGAAGAAGVAAGGNGGSGGNSTFTPAGTGGVLTGIGGSGGIGSGSGYAGQGGTFLGGNGGGATGGDYHHTGVDGQPGFSYYVSSASPAANRLSNAGNGGSSYWGGGGNGPVQWSTTIIGSADGVAATVMGAGGSGSYNSWTTAGRAGGAGADGEILIIEYLGL
jgi:hypothetical protein